MAPAEDEIAQILRVFLASATTLGLATVDEQGQPHAANVNFAASPDLNLYFVSNSASAHARHIAQRPRVAATVYAPFRAPKEIRGVQLRGPCSAIAEGEFESAWRIFQRKFEYASSFEQRIRSEQFYRIAPEWFRYIDNSVRFGFKWETPWPVSPGPGE